MLSVLTEANLRVLLLQPHDPSPLSPLLHMPIINVSRL